MIPERWRWRGVAWRCLAPLLAILIAGSWSASPRVLAAPMADGSAVHRREVPAAASWVPSYVFVETGEIEPGTRYLRMKMMWNDVAGFGATSTYEQDFFLDNYDASPLGPGTYLDRSRKLDQTPRVKSWQSNLPGAYLDTRFGDGTDEIAYTIGAGQASEIKADVEYDTLIVAADGDADKDSARLSAQLGHQVPAGCTSTWCSLDDGTGSIVDIFPAWVIPVPGSVEVGIPPSST
jgi:hypothetical protein